MPRYSVIIPVYKAEAYLTACVDSVLAQDTASDYEVILVDDGSPDRCGTICDGYAAGHPNIRAIHQKNAGASAARNVGIDAAQGDYILFLDSDDLWAPNLLSTVDNFVPGAPDLIHLGHTVFCDTGDRVVPAPFPCVASGESGPEYLEKLTRGRNSVPTTVCSFSMRRSLLNHAHIRFDTSLVCSEDFDVNLSCLQAAQKVVGTAEPLYWYRVNGANRPFRPEVLMCDLKTKAKWFSRIPCPALADLFILTCSVISQYGTRREAADLIRFAESNRSIWRYASPGRMRHFAWLFRVFGVYYGSVVYLKLRDIAHS